MSEAAKLTRGSIRSHLVTQAAPMIVGVAAIMSIGLVDAYFIGQLGPDPLAAIGFIFPISVALTSLGVGVSVGINSVVSRALGAGDLDRARRRGNFGVFFATALGLLMGGALYLLQGPLFSLMQAQPELLPLIEAYMRPFALGFPLLMVIMGVNGVLRGQGEALRTSLVSITYAAANWVLDPLLITGTFGFEGFGIRGAAYATIIGWALGMALGFMLLARTRIPFTPVLAFRTRRGESLAAISKVAGPAAFSNAINPIGLSVLTALVAAEGSAAVAGFGAAGRLQSFAVVPLLGLSAAIGAIVGQNWGAGRPDRSRRAMWEAGAFCLAYGLAMAVLLFFAGEWFARFFTDDPSVVAEFSTYLRIAAWGYAGYGLLIVANGALNAVGKSGLALAQSCARVFLVMLPVALVARPMLGSAGVYAAELAANVLGGALAAGVVWYVLRHRPEADTGEARPAVG